MTVRVARGDRARFRSVIALGAVLALPLLPAAAHAKSVTHIDAAGDVGAFVPPSEVGTPSPDVADQDITASTISHKAREVTVRVTFRDMTPISQHEVDGYYFAFKTPTMHREVLWLTGAAHGDGNPRLSKPRGGSVPCRLTHAIDRVARTVVLTVPRHCLGNPRWVEVAIGTLNSSNATNTLYYDDALVDGTPSLDSPRYGARVGR